MRRRDFISFASVAIVAGPSILPAASAEDGEDPCEYHAKRLAEALENRDGKKWLIEVSQISVFGRRMG